MGNSIYTYIGPVIRIPKLIKMVTEETFRHCSNQACQKYSVDVNHHVNFCDICGSPIIQGVKQVEHDMSWYGVRNIWYKDSKGTDYDEDYLYQPDYVNHDDTIFISNKEEFGINISSDSESRPFNPDMFANALDRFKDDTRTQKILSILDQVSGGQYIVENMIVVYWC